MIFKILRRIIGRLWLFSIVFATSFLIVAGQDFVECKVTDKSLESVEYSIGNIDRGLIREGEITSLVVDISVKPVKINEKDLILIARHIRQRFCNESSLIVGIFDRKNVSKRFDANVKESLKALRGSYVYNKATSEEYILFSTTRDYNENPQKRIRIELGQCRTPSPAYQSEESSLTVQVGC